MISNSVIIGLIVNASLCIGFPILLIIYAQKKYGRVAGPIVFGALCFMISQVVIRIPLITAVLPSMMWYSVMSVNNPIMYYIFLGVTAGIFEEVGRYIFIKIFMKKNHRYGDALAFGIGHGSVEAVLLVGINAVTMVIFANMINAGTFTAELTSLPAESIDMISANLLSATPFLAYLGGIERVFTIIFHIGLTMLVFSGILSGKGIKNLLLAIFIHALVDALAGILPMYFHISVIYVEIIIAIFAVGAFIYTRKIKNDKHWEDEVKMY